MKTNTAISEYTSRTPVLSQIWDNIKRIKQDLGPVLAQVK